MSSDTPDAAIGGTPFARNRSSGSLTAHQRWLAARRNQKRRVVAIQIGLIAAFLLLWEIAPRMHWVNPMLTSYPSAVWRGFLELLATGNLHLHIGVTVFEIVASFTASMVIGSIVAILLWTFPTFQRVADPFLVVLNALPKIALVPIFYIWLGPEGSIYAVSIAISVFITILMLYTGFQQTDPDKVKLIRTLGGNSRQVLTKAVLPGNKLTFLATLKANVGLSLVGVIVGEFQASKAGLGYLIVYGSQIFRMDMVMAAIVILGVISVLLYFAIQALEIHLVSAHRR